jgi:hypothetical protein
MMKLIFKHIQQSSGSVVSEPDSWSVKAEVITKIIRNMSNVQELTFCPSYPRPDSLPHLRDVEYVLRIVAANAWTSFGSSLMSLTVKLSYEGYFSVLTPTLVFARLERLSVTLSEVNRTSDHTKLMCDLLIPFINNHHSTLRCLRLALISYHLNISPCLLGVHRLPHLQQLQFRHIFRDTGHINTSGLRHILEIHSDVLRDLELHFELPYSSIPSNEWYTEGFSDVALPRLESLTLWPGKYLNLGRTAAYLRRLGDSLTTVILDGNTLSFSELEAIRKHI